MSEQKMVRYAQVTKFLGYKTRLMHVPFSGTFELTPRCNMNCRMCYIRMTPEEMEKVGHEMTADEWIRIAQEAVEQGMVMALFTGGEAILYKDFKKVYLAVRKMGVFVSINSNGTLLTGEWLEFFKQYPPAKFNITIYGGCNEAYGNLCRYPKGFEQLKHNIEQLQEAGIEIMLNCMVTKQNVDEMEDMFAFAREHDLTLHVNTYSFPPVRKEGVDHVDQERFTPTEAAEARVRLNWNACNDREKFLKRTHSTLENLVDAESQEDECSQVEGDKVLCAAGRSNFWATWDGRLLPCGMIAGQGESLLEQSFQEAWNGVVARTESIVLAPECSSCPKKNLCMPCAASLLAESGAYDKKAEYKCEYTDEYIRLLGEAVKYLEHENS